MTVEWTKDQIVGIIKEIESRPAIWDSFSSVHRDKDKRRDAYQQVADIVGLPHDAVEKKFSNLRTQYCREINKAQTISNYKSKWFAYKYLSFLKKDILARRTRMFLVKNATDHHNFSPLNFLDENMLLSEEENNITSNNGLIMMNGNSEDLLSCCDNEVLTLDDDNNMKGDIATTDNNVNNNNNNNSCGSGMSSPVSLFDGNNHDDNSVTPFQFHHSIPHPPPTAVGINSKKRKITTLATSEVTNNNDYNNNNNNNNNNNHYYYGSDEYDMFGKSIAAQLRNIKDPYAKSLAKLKIQNALFEAETLNIIPRNNVVKYEAECGGNTSINDNNSSISQQIILSKSSKT